MRLSEGYYPGSTGWENAAPVDAGAGMELTGVNFQLNLTPVFHVRGKLMPGGAQSVVSLRSPNDRHTFGWEQPVDSEVRSDRTFDIPGVRPGSYFLFLDNDRGPLVTVTTKDVEGLLVQAITRFDLKGQVRLAQGAVSFDASGLIVFFEGESSHPAPHGPVAPTPDGAFSITDLIPDRYAVSIRNFRAGTFYYLKSILYNGREITGTTIDLTAGPASELELLVGAGGGQVDGKVSWAEDNKPAGEIEVVLTRAGDRPISAKADQNGHFSFSGLAPSTYLVFAVANYDRDLWGNADFLAQIASRGKSVDAQENGTAHIELAVLPPADITQAEQLTK